MLRVPIGTNSTEILRGYACSMHLVGKSGSLSPSDLERFVVVLWVDGLIVSVLLRQYNSSRFRCHAARNTCRMPTPSLFYTNCLCSLYICFIFFFYFALLGRKSYRDNTKTLSGKLANYCTHRCTCRANAYLLSLLLSGGRLRFRPPAVPVAPQWHVERIVQRPGGRRWYRLLPVNEEQKKRKTRRKSVP